MGEEAGTWWGEVGTGRLQWGRPAALSHALDQIRLEDVVAEAQKLFAGASVRSAAVWVLRGGSSLPTGSGEAYNGTFVPNVLEWGRAHSDWVTARRNDGVRVLV